MISSSYSGRQQELQVHAADIVTDKSGATNWPDLMLPVASDGIDNWSNDVGLSDTHP